MCRLADGSLAAIRSLLGHDAGVHFHFLQGEIECGPGPGVEGFFDGPYYSYYTWPRHVNEDGDASVDDAYSLIYETIEEEGPFDGILGFSHGGATAYGFLAHHAKHHPFQPAFRCAVFFNALPPFKVNGHGKFIYDDLTRSPLRIPSLHIIGKNDFVRSHSLALTKMLEPTSSSVLEHDKGHEIPRDRENTTRICNKLEDLCRRAAW